MMIPAGRAGRIGYKFNPAQQAGKDLAAWFRFNQGITSSSGLVSQWDDASGNAGHLKQATAANRMVDGSVGANLVTNGTFDADTDWVKGTGWSIAGGVAVADNATGAQAIRQPDATLAEPIEDGVAYLLVYTILNYVDGSITPYVGQNGGNGQGTTRSSAGTFSEVIVADADPGSGGLTFTAANNASLEIDNVTLQKISPDGTVYGDGIQRFLKTDAFTLNQPTTVYILFKQIAWAQDATVFDGNTGNKMRLYQNSASPNLTMFAGGTQPSSNPDLAVDTYGVITCVYNGASSLIQTNDNAAVVADTGANDAGGLTLGAAGGDNQFGNIQVAEVIGYSAAHDAGQRSKNIAYLNGIKGLL